MAPPFTNIPPEIRFQIYEYLLLDQNVVTLGETYPYLLLPEYTTSLFTVNKSISEESLQYFYSQAHLSQLNQMLADFSTDFRAIFQRV
jgi:hypothetical protein